MFIRVCRLEIQSGHVCISDSALWTVAPLTFSPPCPVSKYSIFRQCVAGRVLSPVGDHILLEFNTLYLTMLPPPPPPSCFPRYLLEVNDLFLTYIYTQLTKYHPLINLLTCIPSIIAPFPGPPSYIFPFSVSPIYTIQAFPYPCTLYPSICASINPKRRHA